MNIPAKIHTLAIFGLAKNTGKTTTLNAIINATKRTIAITSIGLDGEHYDQINFLPKPQITLPKGTIIATAEETLTHQENMTLIKKTALQTALGPIVIVRTTKRANFLIAGPTSNQDLNKLLDILKPMADLVLIDGALNRKTFTQLNCIDGLILATGASVSKTLDDTVRLTKNTVQLFAQKTTHNPLSLPYKIATVIGQEKTYYQSKNSTILKQCLKPHAKIYFKGAITNHLIDTVLKFSEGPLELIAEDPSKWLFDLKKIDYLTHKQITLSVLHAVKLLAITINPTRPSGENYDAEDFKKQLVNTLEIPVYNVLEGK